ncbi:proline iminopeptidase [Knoellia remsis]|uniref:Proline iminopeptidase n=1 Tax=Knoellia remsis TaxID=407159 RepID=A0A2T0V0W8_9MICO|nr:prolyl aminopeptidase [Knoellia remsis]PRY63823.1 proline iminopeptidase [Knoellia remsis]
MTAVRLPEPWQMSDPFDEGMLDVGDGHRLHYEQSGNPEGIPVVFLHGGPGSGAGPTRRKTFDPEVFRIVLFDQRNSGRSTPSAAEPVVDLSTNTTPHLVADIERLREHVGVDRWMVVGVSWGATLGLAYAEAHPHRVTAVALGAVTNTSAREVEWITRDMGRVFPREWARFVAGVPEAERDDNLAAAYSRLLHHPDPGVREKAAKHWCDWEDTHVATFPGATHDPRYDDPAFRLAFGRLVTHYWGNAGFLEDGQLMRDLPRLAGIPGALVHGRTDISSPLDIPWRIAQGWPDAELVVVGDASHGGGSWSAELRAAVARLGERVGASAGPRTDD